MSDPGISLCYTIDSIAVGESDQGYSETFAFAAGSSAERRLYCAWTDRLNLANYLLTANTYTIGSIVIYVGETHPSGAKLFVDSVKITPTGNPVGQATWSYATLDVGYKSLQFNPDSPTVPREDCLTLSGEVTPIPGASCVFAYDSKQAPFPVNYFVPYMTYTVTLKSVSALPLAAIANCQNKVHSGTMNLKIGATTTTIPGNQVVFNGVDGVKITYLPGGTQKFDYSLSFLIAPVSCNKEYNPGKPGADAMSRFDDIVPAKYLTADFASLGV